MLHKLLRKSLYSFLLLFTLSISIFVIPKIIYAEKCDKYSVLIDNECHSLRPFPGVTPAPNPNASVIPSVVMCGNSVVVTNQIQVTPNGNCIKDTQNKTATCSYSFSKNIDFKITNLNEAELPIMGNTEDVVNLQSKNYISDLANETLTGSDRINQYASWYLNGVLNRAEYPFVDNNKEIQSKVVNFMGPTRKILPQEIQNQTQSTTVARAELNSIGNQVVACVSGFGIPNTPLFVETGIPLPCPLGSVLPLTGEKLKDWIFHLPPVRNEFDNYLKYYIAYKRWRGESCASFTVPIIDISVFLCYDNPLKPNYWSNLFPYVPYSSTEDKQGQLSIGGYIPSEIDGATISNIKVTPGSSNLYFAHMQEVVETSSLIQQTFTAKDETGKLISDSVSPKIQSGCEILQTRTNSGDNLFADSSQPFSSVSFDISFDCTFSLDKNNEFLPNQSCTKNPAVTFSVSTKTPLANEVFSNTVAGSNSIVRRIFPKIGSGSMIGSFFDLPAVQTVSYSTSGNNSKNKDSGSIYFPHIGSILEYFLKGIQTLLRPKGYGEQVTFAAPGHQYSSCGTGFAQFNPPSSTTDKAKTYFDLYIKPNLTDEVMSAYAEAEKVTGVPCEVLAGVHHMEASNDPTKDLQSGAPLAQSGKTLTQSAILAGDEIKGKVGGNLNTWDDLITALSYYNGTGNNNCGQDSRYKGPCPPPPGIDHPYPMAWLDAAHEDMYLIFCTNLTMCDQPFPYFERPGALAVATEVYLAKIR